MQAHALAPTRDFTRERDSATIAGFEGPRLARKVIGFVLANVAEEINLDDLARQADLSRFTFCRRFHAECGIPPMRWLWNFRTQLAAGFIDLDPRWRLTDVAFACGFTSSAHFSRTFKAMFHKSPSAYRREAAARLATLPTPMLPQSEQLFSNRDVAAKAATAALAAG
jgi:transcriptional regulator GlxA family with amidase domain